MLQKLLETHYGVKAEEQLKIDQFDALRGNGWLYLIAAIRNREEADIQELGSIAEHLRKFGDKSVPMFLPTKDGSYIATWEQNKYCVLANRQLEQQQRKTKIGRKLAKFHERGRRVPFQIQRSSRIGQWKGIWEKRLEQMEREWNRLLFQTPEDEFEKMFVDSFPYYMGLTENAIQYLVDTEIDDSPLETDSGTVCHERFTEVTWGSRYFKNPFDWVFDHRSRDLAEWTRERYFRNNQTYDVEVKQFFAEYQSVVPLSPFSWRLLYARLVFPLHYFECVENYYITRSEQEKKLMEEQLAKILRQSPEYERFLAGFFQISGAPINRVNLPQLEWLFI
ncbi:spore coat putative kinase YutH [Neobacillus niacini]|uniref:spore coat putative kinase YutH n=1 Tax=Neobacillus niacini TaxID=86668 RepID=UPI0021CB5FA1|nr:spore coat protein YutH [Neobacillus niacini]MCM3765882.1 spore coat protein YutH [Neobacillus niacini]